MSLLLLFLSGVLVVVGVDKEEIVIVYIGVLLLPIAWGIGRRKMRR